MMVVCSLCTVNTAFSAPSKTKKHAQALDSIVAVINDNVITQSELDSAMDTVKKQLASSNMPAPAEGQLRKQVLDQVINRKLQLFIAEQAGAKITDDEMNKVIADIASKNQISVDQLYEQIAKNGMDVKDYQKEIREELTIQHVQQQEVGSHISISPQEVNDFMRSTTWQAYSGKEYHLEDILIALPENPTTQDVNQAKKHADSVLAQIHQGKSFNELAAAESGSTGALQGGDLGWRQLPEVPSSFAGELVHMKVNDIMGPVQTPNGFHLIKLSDTRKIAKKMDPTEEKKQVEQLIYQRKFEENLQAWLTKLRSSAFINTNPEKLA